MCQAGFLYADDVCLIASNEQDLQRILDSIRGCISEYGMKMSEKKSDLYDNHLALWCGPRIASLPLPRYVLRGA